MSNRSVLKDTEIHMLREKFEVMKFDDYCALAGKVASLQSELAASQVEVARLKREDFSDERMQNESLKFAVKVLGEQLAAAKAEADALRKDAERYRWLKNNDSSIGIHNATDFNDCYYIHEADEEIDAAMSQGEEK